MELGFGRATLHVERMHTWGISEGADLDCLFFEDIKKRETNVDARNLLHVRYLTTTFYTNPSIMNLNMEVMPTEEAEQELGSSGTRGRTSKYEPVAQKWVELDDGESIVLRDLEQNDVQNLRNLLYRRFGKENIIVRSALQDDDTYKAVVRERRGNEYLRQDG